MVFSDEDNILIPITQIHSAYSYTYREIKIGHLECNLFAFS